MTDPLRAPITDSAASLVGAVLALLALGTTADRAAGQGAGGGLEISGAVVDAVSGAPMPGATVILEPEATGAFPSPAGSSFAAAARTTSTDDDGRYRFGDLSAGPYRLSAAMYGYRPYSVVVELGSAGASVSVGLDAEPILLEPIRSRGYSRGPYAAGMAFGSEAEMARLLVADLRRQRFLSTDVRELTYADVVEGVTLGEPDLFRALQRLPGVTTRSDYTAALWTRGAPWSQTRVYYDGIPLFNPLHALGMISGISSSAVGTVWFHPGGRSAALGEGAAGVVDLRSRPASGSGDLNVHGDASLATAGMTLDQRVLDGRAGWMLSGRRTYLDWLADLAQRAAYRDGSSFPYSFAETSGRVDARIGDHHAVEASWLWEGDRLSNSPTDSGDAVVAAWGNALAQGTWTGVFGGVVVQHTVGGSRHHGVVRTEPAVAIPLTDEAVLRSETAVAYATVRGSVWPETTALTGPPWMAGYEVAQHTVDYFGPIPLPVPRGEFAVAPGDPSDPVIAPTPVEWSESLPVVALWGERTWTPGRAVALRAGVRLEGGPAIRDEGLLRVAPRLSVRYSPLPEVALSVGAARVFQYSQAVAPGGVQLASLVSTDAWLLAGDGVPPIRADLVTAGIEAGLAPGRIAAINTFVRYSAGVVVPNPQPGSILTRSPRLAIGRSRASGIEASVRQLTGPVTGSVSYSLSRSRSHVLGRVFPAAADRPHVLNATAMVRPLTALRVGAAFTAASGVPFTRAISDPEECAIEPGCAESELPWAGDPNAVRGPVYASLDLLVDWGTTLAGLQLGVYGQIRNVLGRENATIYTGDGSGCLIVGCSTEDLRNAYEQGVPRLPVIGIRVRR